MVTGAARFIGSQLDPLADQRVHEQIKFEFWMRSIATGPCWVTQREGAELVCVDRMIFGVSQGDQGPVASVARRSSLQP